MTSGIPYQGRIVYLQISEDVFRPAIVTATCCLEPMSESNLVVFLDAHYDNQYVKAQPWLVAASDSLLGYAERRLLGKGVGFFQYEKPPLTPRETRRLDFAVD